jgi:hypothetical protein
MPAVSSTAAPTWTSWQRATCLLRVSQGHGGVGAVQCCEHTQTGGPPGVAASCAGGCSHNRGARLSVLIGAVPTRQSPAPDWMSSETRLGDWPVARGPQFFSSRWGGSSTQAWMPTYVSILRIPQMIWVWESDGGMILTGENRRTRRKTCPSATLSTTNPTCIDPGANPGLRGERPATNDLSHGTALGTTYS